MYPLNCGEMFIILIPSKPVESVPAFRDLVKIGFRVAENDRFGVGRQIEEPVPVFRGLQTWEEAAN